MHYVIRCVKSFGTARPGMFVNMTGGYTRKINSADVFSKDRAEQMIEDYVGDESGDYFELLPVEINY